MNNIKKQFRFQVPLSLVFRGVSITFEGVRGNGYQGDIAIDDVSLEDGSCPNLGDCDFEKDRCTWFEIKDGTDDFDWQLGSGTTLSSSTGPSSDHTLGNAQGKDYKMLLFIENILVVLIG